MADKIGEGHASGMWRMGLNEIRSAVYPGSNIAQQQPEIGVFGRPSQGEIAQARSNDQRELEEGNIPRPESVLANRSSHVQGRDLYGRDNKDQKDHDLDRE